MTTPDRTSIEVAKGILANLLPDPIARKTVCCELASFWQYAKRNYPDKTFITLAKDYIRMNVGMVEVFVIFRNSTLLLVADKTMIAPDAKAHYKSLEDALPIKMSVEKFQKQIADLRSAVFSVINKLGKTRRHPAAPIGHSSALAELLMSEYPYDSALDYPEEVGSGFLEGGVRTITVNAYERDPAARAACLRHYETYVCQICGFDFARVYGPIGQDFIHVHHLRPVSVVGKKGSAAIHPETDMVPVCPNCHAMLHSRKPEPLTPAELKKEMSQNSAPTRKNSKNSKRIIS